MSYVLLSKPIHSINNDDVRIKKLYSVHGSKKKNGSEITDLKYKNRLNIDKMKSKIEWLRIKKYGSTKKPGDQQYTLNVYHNDRLCGCKWIWIKTFSIEISLAARDISHFYFGAILINYSIEYRCVCHNNSRTFDRTIKCNVKLGIIMTCLNWMRKADFNSTDMYMSSNNLILSFSREQKYDYVSGISLGFDNV